MDDAHEGYETSMIQSWDGLLVETLRLYPLRPRGTASSIILSVVVLGGSSIYPPLTVIRLEVTGLGVTVM
jgi:hypothetical protein